MNILTIVFPCLKKTREKKKSENKMQARVFCLWRRHRHFSSDIYTLLLSVFCVYHNFRLPWPLPFSSFWDISKVYLRCSLSISHTGQLFWYFLTIGNFHSTWMNTTMRKNWSDHIKKWELTMTQMSSISAEFCMRKEVLVSSSWSAFCFTSFCQ